ncbi:FlxA-like family protein [Pseudodesulfovibrio sediminis]|uniref:FlxA-like protein n=1 Tax=Pseudodesulfovibrio sediminis TaxID=2810563 RepID=A0ABM7P7E3_9BACT|nr:FlxA-like family protein [Pseudodesulfovibrio sediminis]BCS88876.1 hypothetical protein PSDVSF_21180 [Pseudodesulfovibrio sediminis]
MAIESLAQQTSVFVDSLGIKPTATEKKADDASQEAKTPEQGDTITISEEARALAAMEKPDESSSNSSEEGNTMDSTIQMLKKQIEELEEDIKELEDGDLPEKEKLTQLQDKQVQLMQLKDQLLKAQQEQLGIEGMADGGGTRANGAGNSAASF